jgi:hypothetical protein
MTRLRAVIVIAVAFAFGFVPLFLGVANGDSAHEDQAQVVQGDERTSEHDDDEDDDGDGDDGINLERRPIAGRGPPEIRYVPGELLVRFRAGTSTAEIEAAADRAGGTVVGPLPGLGLYVIKVPPARTDEALASLRSEASVESV